MTYFDLPVNNAQDLLPRYLLHCDARGLTIDVLSKTTIVVSTERRQVKGGNRDYAQQLRALSRRLVNAQEEERRRLTRELHDRVGPSLTALNILLNRMAGDLSKHVPDRTRRYLRESLNLVEATAESIENVMLDLRAPMLERYGLLRALRWYAQLFAKRTGIATTVNGQDPAPRLDRETEMALFRIMQEALTNVAKHAHTMDATIALHQENGAVTLTVADKGTGFAGSASERRDLPRCGIAGMHERARAVGGTLRIESSPGAGTRVRVEIGCGA
jgi:signal transduction histidine kinase